MQEEAGAAGGESQAAPEQQALQDAQLLPHQSTVLQVGQRVGHMRIGWGPESRAHSHARRRPSVECLVWRQQGGTSR